MIIIWVFYMLNAQIGHGFLFRNISNLMILVIFMVGIDIYGIIKDIIRFYRKRKIEKIPIGKFKKLLKFKIKSKLHSTPSNQFIEGFIDSLDEDGRIYIDSTGHRYVLTREISF